MNMMPICNVKLNLWPLLYVQYNVYMVTIVLMSIYILWYQKKADFLSSSLGSALSRVFFFLFSNDFSICSASERLIMLRYSVSKAKKMQLEYSSVYINSNENKYPDGTQIQKMFGYIFMCLHFANKSSFLFHLIFFWLFFFLCYHYMWISPRMLYIQYVDMHLYSFFASLNLDSSYFNAASLSFCWIYGEILLILLYSCHHYNPASRMATVPFKVTWKVSVNIALSLAFILAELNPERKFSPEIPNSHKTAWKPQVFFF